MALRHRLHRGWAGARRRPELVRDADRPLPYYEGDEPPLAPPGAVIRRVSQANWDGGPPLIERVAVIEEAMEIEETRRLAIDAAIGALARSMRPLGVDAIATCTWITGEPRARSLLAHRPGDRLRTLYDLVDEVAARHGIRSPAGTLASRTWEAMARAEIRFPEALDDPYGVFGPSGPPPIPATWRGRAVRDLDDPYPALRALVAMDLELLALTAEEAVLAAGP